jgi:hypothetical protein
MVPASPRKGEDIMGKMLKLVITATVGAAAIGLIDTPAAAAGCAFPDELGRSAPHRSRPQAGFGEYRPALFLLAGDHDRHDDDDNDGIVGLWHANFVSKGSQYIPDDTPIDSAYVQWHSDGTEMMNSSRPPATGSFCMGVWEKTGRYTYRLNHVAAGRGRSTTSQARAYP